MIKKRFLTFLALLCLTVSGAWAQETLTVYDATDPDLNFHVPVRGVGANGYLKCEMVYPASEIRGMAGGTINKMMYYTNVQATKAWTGTFQVFMKEVTDASISSFYGTDGATIVYEGTLNGTQSTMEITFSTPYHYNGGNLLVGVYQTVPGNWTDVKWAGKFVQGASVQGADGSSLSSVSPGQQNFLPKATFTYKAPAPAPTNLDVTPESITAREATVTWTGNSESYVVSLGVYDYNAQPTFEPFIEEGFYGSMPTGWTHIGSGTASPESVSASHTHTGKALKFGGATSDNVVVLPKFVVEANTLTIDFWSKAETTNLNNSGYFDLGYVTDATNSNTFVALEEYSCANHGSAYVHIENYSLAAVPAGARIAFRHRSGKANWYWFIDDVTVSGFVYPTNWTEYSTSNQTYTFENLTPNTLYQVKVKGYSGDEGYSLETAPVGFTTAANPSGSCGANLSWEFDPSNGTLTITGTGAMDDYDYAEHQVPWLSSIDGITSVIIPDGVTRIGNCAFYACTALTSIEIPGSVTSIGDEAFYGCSLASVTVNATTPPTLGTDAFAGTAEGLKIYVPARSVDDYKAAWAAYADKITTPTYTVTLKEGTEDADNWTITPPEAKTTGVAEGTEVTATYSGTKLVKSVKAVKKAPAPSYPLLSAVTTSDYGKVVCAAGHLHDAKTAVPDGCTAVGIIGKVTETGHGLILALQDAAQQNWNTINGWTSETTYAGTTLKVLPDDAARGSLTSYTTLGETTVSNWAVAQKSDYEAIFTNLGSTKSDSDGTTYDDNVNAYITTGVGGTAISDYNWSATSTGTGTAWYFRNKYWDGSANSASYSVRPVLGF